MIEGNQLKQSGGNASSERTKNLMGLFLLLLALLVYAFWLRPVSHQLDASKAQTTQKQGELGTLKTKLKDLEEAEKELQLSTEVQRIGIFKSIPNEVKQDEIIRDIIKIAGEYNITLNSIGFSRGSSGDAQIGVVGISSSFEGNYLDLIDFLQGLEQNGRLFKVNSVSVQLHKLEVNDIERANFSLTIETFYQK